MTAAPEKPAILPVEPDAIPAELRAVPQWILWRLEWDAGRGEWTKRPYSPRAPRLASSTDPETWDTFGAALRVYRGGRYDGIGFVFTADDPYIGVDLDHVCEDGAALELWAAEAVALLASYTERSVRGGGVHVIVRGTIPAGRRKRGQVEMYDRGRFFTVTGAVVGDTTEIGERTAELAALHLRHLADPANERAWQAPPTPLTPRIADDAELVERAMHARNGESFSALWHGVWVGFPSQSEADRDLCKLLAFWTGGDVERIDRLFRLSGLMRGKWDESRGALTYGQRTITEALGKTTAFYSGQAGQAEPPRRYQPSDLGNAERLIDRHGADLRYNGSAAGWFVWGGAGFRRDDEDALTTQRAIETIRAIYTEAADEPDSDKRAALVKHALKSEAAPRLAAMVKLGSIDARIRIAATAFDADGFLAASLSGAIDLRSGTLRPIERADLTTRLLGAAFDPDAPCPQWLTFLARIMGGNQRIISFLQRAAGYSLTGDSGEQVLFLLYGTGANGKSTFLDTLRAALGEYAAVAQFDTFLQRDREGVRSDLARLAGVRFVSAVEADAAKRLSESVVKQLTGGDAVTARFLFHDEFTYTPRYKLWLAANHKPAIRGTDEAIWRRIRLIPFATTIPEAERDRRLPERLRAELPGILAWAVRGCLDWQRNGLGVPDEVRQATESYRTEMDTLGMFFDECCVRAPQASAASGALYKAYAEWARSRSEYVMTQTAFGRQLSERGFTQGISGTGNQRTRGYQGIGLLAEGFEAPENLDRVSPWIGLDRTFAEPTPLISHIEEIRKNPIQPDPEDRTRSRTDMQCSDNGEKWANGGGNYGESEVIAPSDAGTMPAKPRCAACAVALVDGWCPRCERQWE